MVWDLRLVAVLSGVKVILLITKQDMKKTVMTNRLWQLQCLANRLRKLLGFLYFFANNWRGGGGSIFVIFAYITDLNKLWFWYTVFARKISISPGQNPCIRRKRCYLSNVPCDCPSTALVYSEQETEMDPDLFIFSRPWPRISIKCQGTKLNFSCYHTYYSRQVTERMVWVKCPYTLTTYYIPQGQ